MVQRRVLVVDDDPDDWLLLKNAFEQLGYDGIAGYEEHGENALQYLHQACKTNALPKLVILDVNMPMMSGIQVLKAIKGNPQLKDLDVIMFSTASAPIFKNECLSHGASNYLVKPSDFKTLITIASEFCRLAIDQH